MRHAIVWLGLAVMCSSWVSAGDASFVLADKDSTVSILCDTDDATVVQKAADLLAGDIERVTGQRPAILHELDQARGNVIIIGSLEKSKMVQSLQVDASDIAGQWERYLWRVVEHPTPTVDQALVIAGSDRRGTAYGVFDLSQKIGVSPWVWWADVTPARQETVILKDMDVVSAPPAVKYRGIFLNDEDWGLQPWAAKTYEPETDDIGPKTYARIFELLLRLKANLIWPAMHHCTKAFYHYPQNRQVADDYAIVVGSSHCEQMLCNNVDEWDGRRYGPYNYGTNRQSIVDYWQRRAQESRDFENIYTLGMRGIHDSGMVGVSSMSEKVAILDRIIADQREIVHSTINADVTKVAQVFTPYKEVLEIYDAGLKLPEDVTIVWPDDNYGYIRRLNNPEEMSRSGGGGVYYHLSYWGRPHDYLWLSTTHPALIREEMNKARQLKSDRLWVFNVGDIKPAEYNLSLCLDMAWAADRFSQCGSEREHMTQWHRDIFGPSVGTAIAEILWEYYDLAFERRPEFMGWSQVEPRRQVQPTQFNHFFNNDEAQQRLDRYHALVRQVEALKPHIQSRLADAYFQLVYYPIVCAAAMNDKVLYQEKALLYARQSRASATDYATWAQEAYDRIVQETECYNQQRVQGKWRDMMCMAPRDLVVFQRPMAATWNAPNDASWGLAVEGFGDQQQTPDLFMTESGLPSFNRWTQPRYFIDIFMKGQQSVTWQAQPSADWIEVSPASGTLTAATGQKEQRLWVSIDWDKAPARARGSVTIEGSGQRHQIGVQADNADVPDLQDFTGAVEDNRYISIFAEHYSEVQNTDQVTWTAVKGLGYTGSVIMAGPLVDFPTIDPEQLADQTASVCYDFYCFSRRSAEVTIYGLPIHPLNQQVSQRFAVSIDDQAPQVLDFKTIGRSEIWKLNVLSNTAVATLQTDRLRPGIHHLKLYAIDPGVIIDRITIDLGGLQEAYSAIKETRIAP